MLFSKKTNTLNSSDYFEDVHRYKNYNRYISGIIKKAKNEFLSKKHRMTDDSTVKVLDLCAGTGIPLNSIIEDKSVLLFSVDFSLDLIRKNNSNIKLLADVEALPFKNETFDIVFCLQSTWYFNDIYKFIKDVHPILSKDGVLVFDIQNFLSPRVFFSYFDIWRINRFNFIRILYRPFINIVRGNKIFHGIDFSRIFNFKDSITLSYLSCILCGGKYEHSSSPSIPNLLEKQLSKYFTFRKIPAEKVLYDRNKVNSFRIIYFCNPKCL